MLGCAERKLKMAGQGTIILTQSFFLPCFFLSFVLSFSLTLTAVLILTSADGSDY